LFEVLQKFSDTPVKTHATCGGTVERLISTSAFQFKGSGFYITDYTKKNGSSSDHGKSDGKNGGNGSAKTETTASKPPDSKSESKPTSSPQAPAGH
jgi:putative FmdB family regulatory protein